MNEMKPVFIVNRPSRLDFLDWSIRFGIRWPDGSLEVAQPVEMAKVKPNEAAPDQPMLRLHNEYAESALTSLMDELWRAGIRPSDIGTAGHLAATQAHLNDMRAIVARNLGVELK